MSENLLRNPKEFFCVQEKQTFFVLNELAVPTVENGSEPLLFHHETFSRFRVVLINAENKSAVANIPVNDLPGIFEAVRMKNFMRYMPRPAVKGENGGEPSTGPAYTVRIASGSLRGRTPAELLMENPEKNKPLLENQAHWLEQNLKQYPRNQVQIDAIKEALELYQNGKLKKDAAAPVADSNTIYKTGMRPLVRRKRDDGKSFVYEIEITWREGMPKPVEIEIRNYYAPVVTRENGMLNVLAKEKDSEIRNIFSLSVEDWFWFEHMAEAQIRTFEDLHAPEAYKAAYEQERLVKDKFGRKSA